MKDLKIVWINLERAIERRRKTLHCIKKGGWTNSYRISATDGSSKKNKVVGIPAIYSHVADHLGLTRWDERQVFRRTNKNELACTISWMRAVRFISKLNDFNENQWYLIIEDDIGSSLSCPEEWPFDMFDIIYEAEKKKAQIVQLCPINGRTRQNLYKIWLSSKQLLTPKTFVKSHGNGAVLVRGSFAKKLSKFYLGEFRLFKELHIFISHINVRPVADKFIYSCANRDGVYVLNYPLFCLQTSESYIHSDHLNKYHARSRDTTLEIWTGENKLNLIKEYKNWCNI